MNQGSMQLGPRIYRNRALAIALLICVVLYGCGSNGSQPVVTKPSGIRGVAVFVGAGGTTTQSVLPDATISIQKVIPAVGSGPTSYSPVIAQTQTDAQGNFSIALPAGTYQVTGSATQPVTYNLGAVIVDVPPNQFLQVTFTFVKS